MLHRKKAFPYAIACGIAPGEQGRRFGMFWRKKDNSQSATPTPIVGQPQVAQPQVDQFDVARPEEVVVLDRESSASATEQQATWEDVVSGYRLFLGREAESPDVIAERAGQTMSDMLHGFFGSGEFEDQVARAIGDASDVDDVFRQPAPQDLRDWAIGYFAPSEDQRRQIMAGDTLLDLRLAVLALPTPQRVLREKYGADGAAALAMRPKKIAPKHDVIDDQPAVDDQPQDPGTTLEDVHNLYILMHDRLPETATVAVARPQTPFLDTVMEFMTSREFALNITSAALNGRLGDRQQLGPALRAWASAAFGIELDHHTTRQKTMVAILLQPEVAERLEAAQLMWSAPNVARNLESVDDTPEAVSPEPTLSPSPSTSPSKSFYDLVEESGLFNAEWYMAHNVDLRRGAADPLSNFDNPLSHFVNYGAAERRNPGPGFDSIFYLEENSDVETSGLFPFEHYLRIGRAAGAAATGPSAYGRWSARFDELTSEDTARIIASAAISPLPRIVCLQVAENGDARDLGRARAAIAGQIGAEADLRVISKDDGGVRPANALDDVPAGSIVVLLGGEALPRAHACFVLANILARDEAEAAYSDHDRVDAQDVRARPVFTPSMSPDFMRRQAYAGPLVAVRLNETNRTLVVQAIAAATDGDASAAFAALLLALAPKAIKRVPLLLFSVMDDREDDPSDPFTEIYEPIRKTAIEAAAVALRDPPQVCILIPTRDRWELLKDCIDSIFANTDYPADRMNIMVIDNDSSEPESLAYLESLSTHPQCSVLASPGPFNFAKICNDGAAATDAEVLLFLNNDMTVREPDWLTALVTNVIRPEIGIVGTQLLYPDDTVQHGGVIIGWGGVAGHRLLGTPADEAMRLDNTREMTAVTGACLAIRKEVFEEVGGFDTVLGVAFNDVVLCMDVFQAGYRNLYVGRPLLYHHESKSRGFDDTAEKVARNAREAIYTRTRYDALFRDDPSYNPNLTLYQGSLATPPRVLRPWRRSGEQPHALILSLPHGIGHGVSCVVALQAEMLVRRGWTVTIGGPTSDKDRPYPGCRRAKLSSDKEAAAYAVTEGVDCVIAHTPPFFSIGRYLGSRPLVYFYDHGEPPPALFVDTKFREGLIWEKRFCAPIARRVFVISEAIRDQQFRRDAIVLRNGNTHLSAWTPQWAERRAGLRRRLGFEGKFVVLNVCRFHEAERDYKGIDDYMALVAETRYCAPEMASRTEFVLAGRGHDDDVTFVRKGGLNVFANISDEEMAELYAAADLYVNLSHWEGYNLGIGQALAMGLEVVASDIPAHREFGIPTGDSTPKLCQLVEGAFNRWDEFSPTRKARLESWDEPLSQMVDIIEEDLAEDAKGPWL